MAKGTDAASRWLASMTAPQAVQNYKDGVNACNVNPMELAANAQQQYLAGVQDAVNSGRMKAALMATPVSLWKQNATNKGATRLSGGAQAAASKVQAHFQKWTPIYASISQACANLPSGGLANAMQRVQTAYSMLKNAAGKNAS